MKPLFTRVLIAWLTVQLLHLYQLRQHALFVEAVDELDWDIGKIGVNVASFFGPDNLEQAIIFRYRVPLLNDDKTCNFQVYLDDCLTYGSDDSIYVGYVDTKTVQYELTAQVGVNVTTVTDSNFYHEIDNTRGTIDFCGRIDCSYQGLSVNFYEVILRITLDLTSSFLMDVQLYDSGAREKSLADYSVSLMVTDGSLSDESLILVETAGETFVDAELNSRLESYNNPVVSDIAVFDQEAINLEGTRFLQQLEQQAQSSHEIQLGRRLATGSRISLATDVTFKYYPAPSDDEAERALYEAWRDNAAYFLSNLTAIIDFCTGDFANITDSQLEQQMFLAVSYGNNTDFNATGLTEPDESTVYLGELLETLQQWSKLNDHCSAVDEILDVYDAIDIESIGGTRVKVTSKLDLAATAFFCNDANEPVPQPQLSQGDSLQVCTSMGDTTSYHVKNTYSFSMTQILPTELTFSTVSNGEVVFAGATQSCTLGVCNHKTIVPSQFFASENPGPIRIDGVAILGFGEATGRRELRRTLRDEESEGAAFFELTADLVKLETEGLGDLIPNHPDPTKEKPEWFLPLVCGAALLVAIVATFMILYHRTKKNKQEIDKLFSVDTACYLEESSLGSTTLETDHEADATRKRSPSFDKALTSQAGRERRTAPVRSKSLDSGRLPNRDPQFAVKPQDRTLARPLPNRSRSHDLARHNTGTSEKGSANENTLAAMQNVVAQEERRSSSSSDSSVQGADPQQSRSCDQKRCFDDSSTAFSPSILSVPAGQRVVPQRARSFDSKISSTSSAPAVRRVCRSRSFDEKRNNDRVATEIIQSLGRARLRAPVQANTETQKVDPRKSRSDAREGVHGPGFSAPPSKAHQHTGDTRQRAAPTRSRSFDGLTRTRNDLELQQCCQAATITVTDLVDIPLSPLSYTSFSGQASSEEYANDRSTLKAPQGRGVARTRSFDSGTQVGMRGSAASTRALKDESPSMLQISLMRQSERERSLYMSLQQRQQHRHHKTDAVEAKNARRPSRRPVPAAAPTRSRSLDGLQKMRQQNPSIPAANDSSSFSKSSRSLSSQIPKPRETFENEPDDVPSKPEF